MGAVQSSGVEELSSHSGQGGGLVQKKASTHPDPVFINSVFVQTSVADPAPNPDPSAPYVCFGPPGFGSGSSYHQAKKVRKILIPTVVSLLFDFLSLKQGVNLP